MHTLRALIAAVVLLAPVAAAGQTLDAAAKALGAPTVNPNTVHFADQVARLGRMVPCPELNKFIGRSN